MRTASIHSCPLHPKLRASAAAHKRNAQSWLGSRECRSLVSSACTVVSPPLLEMLYRLVVCCFSTFVLYSPFIPTLSVCFAASLETMSAHQIAVLSVPSGDPSEAYGRRYGANDSVRPHARERWGSGPTRSSGAHGRHPRQTCQRSVAALRRCGRCVRAMAELDGLIASIGQGA